MSFKFKVDLITIVLGIALFFFFNKSQIQFPNDNQKISRNQVFDFLRGLAIIGIVCIHIESYFKYLFPEDPKNTYLMIFSNLNRFSVPLFLYSSILFLKDGPAYDYWSKKFKALVVPYLFACVVSYGFKYKYEGDWYLDFGLRLIFGKVLEPYYFVPLLLQFYLLFKLLAKYLHKIPIQSAIVGALVLHILSNYFILPNIPPTLMFYLDPIIITNYVFFFFVGIGFKQIIAHQKLIQNYLEQKNTKMFIGLLLGLGIIAISAMTYIYRDNVSNKTTIYPILALIMLYLWGTKLQEKDSVFFKVVKYIGENTLSIFLLHPLVIHFMHIIYPQPSQNVFVYALIVLVVCIINVGVPLGIGYAIEKITELTRKKAI